MHATESIVFVSSLRNENFERSIYLVVDVRVSVTSITEKQIIAQTPNLVIYICITHSAILEGMKNRVCVQEHTKDSYNITT